jgi:hypothetical protein
MSASIAAKPPKRYGTGQLLNIESKQKGKLFGQTHVCCPVPLFHSLSHKHTRNGEREEHRRSFRNSQPLGSGYDPGGSGQTQPWVTAKPVRGPQNTPINLKSNAERHLRNTSIATAQATIFRITIIFRFGLVCFVLSSMVRFLQFFFFLDSPCLRKDRKRERHWLCLFPCHVSA